MQIFNNQPRMKKIIGLRNIVTRKYNVEPYEVTHEDGTIEILNTKSEWKYLIFYDVDNPSEGDIKNIIDFMEQSRVSYIIYSTKHGIHIIGLSPLNAMKWASMHDGLLGLVPEYFSGQTIRVSLKEGEKQELIFYNLQYPLMRNLLQVYLRRFPKLLDNNDGHNCSTAMTEYHLVFEKYWSKKI